MAARLGLHADRSALLERYLDLLYAAGRQLNLTTVPRELAGARHLDESLSLIPLRRWEGSDLVVDLGSGGGVPGIPLAIALPEVRFQLVERTLKKADFLRRCIESLPLPNVEVVALDALEYARGPGRHRAMVAVSRAAGPVQRLLPALAQLLAPGGEALMVVARGTGLGPELRRDWARLGGGPPELVDTGVALVLRLPLQD